MKPRASQPRRTTPVVLLCVLGVGIGASYWYFKTRSRSPDASPSTHIHTPIVSLLEVPWSASSFDLELELPGDPLGLVGARTQVLAGNRKDPWGFIRLRSDEADQFAFIEKVPVIEPTYNQRIGLTTLTWNGEHVIGYTDGAWFQKQDQNVFTIHDPASLAVIRHVPAPKGLGGLAWDGSGYWAASRRNTKHADEPAWLYRLNESFQVVSTSEPPGVGCQGLAWDGAYLWFVDVFSGSVYVLDVSSGTPALVHTQETPFDYLSGIAHFKGRIWIAEYGTNRLYRLKPTIQASWTNSGAAPAQAALPSNEQTLAEALPSQLAIDNRQDEDEIRRLREQLRSDDTFERMEAWSSLKRAGVPIDYDRHEDPFPSDPAPDEIEVLDWAIEMRQGSLYGSWNIFFGEEVFESDSEAQAGIASLPLFARYTITVKGGALSGPVERVFDAIPGENFQQDVLLASELGPGEYTADIFIQAQFVDEEGTWRIFNKSMWPLEVEQR